jgi:hypothetical protein
MGRSNQIRAIARGGVDSARIAAYHFPCWPPAFGTRARPIFVIDQAMG